MSVSSKIKSQKSKVDPIVARLNRVIGQMEGVKKMYIKDKCNCVETVQQLAAAKAALAKISQLILLDETKRCADEGDIKKLKKIINSTFHSI